MSKNLILACIADDFTGASDAASFLVKGGMNTVLFNGIPDIDTSIDEDIQAVVIALKTRTQETKSAVKDSLAAADWVSDKGAKHLYIKYCSTFDSTKEGNIGPIVDSILEKYGDKYTILVPALPVNKRVVREGILYVDGIPLHMSHMKDHPLTPMWESDIAKLMEPQAKYESFKVNKEMLKESKEDILEKLDEFGKTRKHFYVIPDFVEDEDARKIVEVFGDLKVLTGGSGLMTELAKRHGKNATRSSIVSSKTKGPALILAGSSSKATLGQVVHFIKSGKKALRMEPLNLIDGSQTIDDIWNFVVENKDEDILIYSSASPDEVKKNQEAGRERVASLLENTTALIAKRAAKNGFNRIIVAGGETSGAVTKSLGFDAYIIGESVAPGVPIMVPLNNRDFRLVLKSGNFGQEDFFIRALEMTGE